MPKYSHLNSGANVQDPNLRIDNRVVVRLKCGRAFVCSWSAHADDIRTGIFGLSLSIPIVHTIKIKLIRHLPGKRQMWKGEKVLLMRLLAHSCRVDKPRVAAILYQGLKGNSFFARSVSHNHVKDKERNILRGA